MSIAQTCTQGTKCKSGHQGQQLSPSLARPALKMEPDFTAQGLLCVLGGFHKCRFPSSSQGVQVGGLGADPGTGEPLEPGVSHPCPLPVCLCPITNPSHCPVKTKLGAAPAAVLPSWTGLIHCSLTAQASGVAATHSGSGING